MRPDSPAPADPWMDRFLAAFAQRQPVDATFIGIRGHDHRLPDVSPEGVDAHLGEMRNLLAEAEASGPIEGLAALDRRIAEGYLRIRRWEMESRFRLSNPSVHAGEASTHTWGRCGISSRRPKLRAR